MDWRKGSGSGNIEDRRLGPNARAERALEARDKYEPAVALDHRNRPQWRQDTYDRGKSGLSNYAPGFLWEYDDVTHQDVPPGWVYARNHGLPLPTWNQPVQQPVVPRDPLQRLQMRLGATSLADALLHGRKRD